MFWIYNFQGVFHFVDDNNSLDECSNFYMVILTYLYIIILSFWQLNLSWKQTFNCFCGKFGTEVSRAAFGWWVVSYFGLLTCGSNDIIWCIVFCLLVELAVFKTRKCTTCYLEKKHKKGLWIVLRLWSKHVLILDIQNL